MTMLVRVESPYFVAGIELDEETGVCVQAAPILKWCLGKHYRDIRPEFRARGFKAKNVGCNGIKKSLPSAPSRTQQLLEIEAAQCSRPGSFFTVDRGSVHVNGRRVSPGAAARAFVARTLAIAEKHHGVAAYDWEPDEP